MPGLKIILQKKIRVGYWVTIWGWEKIAEIVKPSYMKGRLEL